VCERSQRLCCHTRARPGDDLSLGLDRGVREESSDDDLPEDDDDLWPEDDDDDDDDDEDADDRGIRFTVRAPLGP